MQKPAPFVSGWHRPVGTFGSTFHLKATTRAARRPLSVEANEHDRGGYIGSDGRRKASLEDAAKDFHYSNTDSDSSDSEGEESLPSWRYGWQIAERNLTWNNDLKSRLIQVRPIWTQL